MKAIFINAKKKQVTEVEFNGDYLEISKICGYDYFDCVTLNRKRDTLYVDDEGLINGTDFGFVLNGNTYAGNGLIIGCTPSGQSCDTTLTVEQVKSMTLF